MEMEVEMEMGTRSFYPLKRSYSSTSNPYDWKPNIRATLCVLNVSYSLNDYGKVC
jgi:hypothetical protein